MAKRRSVFHYRLGRGGGNKGNCPTFTSEAVNNLKRSLNVVVTNYLLNLLINHGIKIRMEADSKINQPRAEAFGLVRLSSAFFA